MQWFCKVKRKDKAIRQTIKDVNSENKPNIDPHEQFQVSEVFTTHIEEVGLRCSVLIKVLLNAFLMF